jgi:serine/threonine protein kinase
LSDFGFTSEGGSETLQPSDFARGTAGFRAPELIHEDQFQYNNKVDIWALGCVLYFIASGGAPFPSDSAVLEFSRGSGPLEVEFDEQFNAETRIAIAERLGQMLARDPFQRPRAADLRTVFQSYAFPPPAGPVTFSSETFNIDSSREIELVLDQIYTGLFDIAKASSVTSLATSTGLLRRNEVRTSWVVTPQGGHGMSYVWPRRQKTTYVVLHWLAGIMYKVCFGSYFSGVGGLVGTYP